MNSEVVKGSAKYQTMKADMNNSYLFNSNMCSLELRPLTEAKNISTSMADAHVLLCYTPEVDQSVIDSQSQLIKDMWPVPSDSAWKEAPQFCALYTTIKSYNLPNFLGAKVTLESGLKLDEWQSALQHYHDREICAFLRFGWPIGYKANKSPSAVNVNHHSALAYKEHVEKFIKAEHKLGAVVGPFSAPPFTPWCRLSPLLTRPKKDSEARRIIVDLSFPEGDNVNEGIDITSVYGKDITYSLPTISDLAQRVIMLGRGAWMWKADLSRAYRQLRIDPLDTPLLGIQVDKSVYLDLCPSFGCRSSSSACQRVSQAVVYLMQKMGYNILAYLDDYAGAESSEEKALQAYTAFMDLSKSLGLELALNKCEAPTTKITWLGFLLDSEEMVVSIPSTKLQEVLLECDKWMNRTTASKSMIQSLLGKLMHLAHCITAARKFTSRITGTLSYMHSNHRSWTTISSEFKEDVNWFREFAELSNGRALITPKRE